MSGLSGGPSDGPAVELLGPETCMMLLRSYSFGRLCTSGADGVVAVDPTTYALHGPALCFRAAAFGQVARRGRSRPVTLQVDDGRDDRPPTWSVTVTGPVSRVTDAATLAALWSAPRTPSWEAGVTAQWLALGPETVVGRRVPRPG